MWMRRLFIERRTKGLYNVLVKDLMLSDHEYFFKSFRMTPTRFEELLSFVAPHIQKSSKIRDVTSPSERLCITLRYLVTGDAQTTIASSYRVSPPTVSRIVRETCEVIWYELNERNFLKVPSTEDSWRKVADAFETKWNFPHCLGAIDGKHVVMQAPSRSGSDYFNYKKTHSIVLMAVCNANYEFTLLDIGDAGRQSDGGVYKNSKLGFAIDNNQINIPPPGQIRNAGTKLYPYVFVADDAFMMKPFMLKPFARLDACQKRKIFYYRLSRARRVIENCFGIAAARFRIFRRPIIAQVDTVNSITKAVVGLHNFLMVSQRMHSDSSYCPPGFTDQESVDFCVHGEWRSDTVGYTGLVNIGVQGSNNYNKTAKAVRDDFKEYFNSQSGAVSWQWDYVNRTIDPFDV